ncbi:MAG: FAD-binding oxidoreductase [Acidimicrobiia bacterium]|nr:FAD-binding oxidoreductase [Acidimicrobiia bacterium]
MLQNLGSSSYWHETSRRVPGPALTGRHDVDVAIVGGGYTGLWTAYQLRKAEPSMKVAVIEREVIGFGASGRNGGFAMTLLDMSLAHLRRNHGDAAAKAAHDAVAASVEEMGQAIAENDIECEWKHGGLMVVATNRGQQQRVDRDLEAAEALGLDGFTRLSREKAQAEVHSPTYVGGLREEHCAVVHPAKLVRGLARVVEGMGVDVFEGTDIETIDESGGKLRVISPKGVMYADQVVLATNAWAIETPWFQKKVVPLYTYIAMTEPLTDEQWATVGWESHCGIEDKRNYVHYYRRTLDGRILWGGSDGIIPFRGRVSPRLDRNDKILERLTGTFRRTFPSSATCGSPTTGAAPWESPSTSCRSSGRSWRAGFTTASATTATASPPSHTGGKILRDKVLGKPSELTELCIVDSKEPGFPPEPLRWIGGGLTRRALLRQDAQFDENRGGGEMDPLLLRVMKKLG